MPIERVEVFLDDAAEPLQVLRQPPFKLKLDTRTVPDGEHVLRVVTHYHSGGQDVQIKTFKVSNLPGVMVQGLDDGAEVRGDLEISLRIADKDIGTGPQRFPGLGAAITTALLLLVIWAFFAVSKVPNKILEEVAPPAKTGETKPAEGTVAVSVDKALLEKGQALFQSCAGCHGANGEGGFGPAFAGNANLKDTKIVVSVITKGRGNMPPQSQLDAESVAAVVTYIRNSFGNNFGGVSAKDVEAVK